ncbi:MAG: hypothetical protein HOE69_00800 [Euryarchaeota archaeon]|jgi:hypothetical protein|nr:hypothetical protein [Euryarchaeota archaeon]
MSFGRVLLYLALLFGILFQLFLSGEWGNEMYGYIFTGSLLLLAAFLLMSKSKPKKKPVRRRVSASEQSSDEDEFQLPEAVVEDEDGGSRRDRKVAASSDSIEETSNLEDEDGVIQLEEDAIEEEIHVAEEYVVDISAEQVEEADIEEFVEERRGQRADIKRRIEERRRGQLAEIRASAARMWSKQDDGEDLLSLLAKPGHGLTVLDEPENVVAGHPYGATYVRIDDARILKLRIPLDTGFVAATEFEEEVEVTIDELPLPPPPDGLPLPPPPTMGQSKLDAMRDEIGG